MPEGVGVISAGRAFIEVLPHTAGFSKNLEGQMARVGRRMQAVGSTLTKHVTLPIVAIFGLAAAEGVKAEKAEARMEAAYKASGLEVDKYRDSIDKTLESSRKLGFEDNAVRDSLGSLIVATGKHTLAVKLLSAAQNIARFRHIKLQQATKMLTMTMTGSQRAAKMLGLTVVPVTKNLDKLTAGHNAAWKAAHKQEIAHAKLIDKQATGLATLDLVQKKLHGQAKAFSETTEGKMEKFTAEWTHLLELLGEKMIPVLSRIVEKLTGLATTFDHLSPTWKKVIVFGLVFLALLGPLVGIIGTIVVAVSGLAAAFTALAAGEILATGPILLIIGAVALLAVGVFLLYRRFAIVRTVVNAFAHAAGAAITFVRNHWRLLLALIPVIGPALSLIIGHFNTFKAIVSGVIDFVRNHWRLLLLALGPVGLVILTIVNHFRTFKAVAVPAAQAVGTAIKQASGYVKTLIDWVQKLIGWISKIHWPHVPSLPGGGLLKKLAGGGPLGAMEPAIVGENGPEIFVPESAGRIIPNRIASQSGDGGAYALVITNWHEGTGFIRRVAGGRATRMNSINTQRERMSS